MKCRNVIMLLRIVSAWLRIPIGIPYRENNYDELLLYSLSSMSVK